MLRFQTKINLFFLIILINLQTISSSLEFDSNFPNVLNHPPKTAIERTSSSKDKYIALYRGIHFFPNLVCEEKRNCSDALDIGKPLFSSAVTTFINQNFLAPDPSYLKSLIDSGKIVNSILNEFKTSHRAEYNIFHQTYTNNHFKYHYLLDDPTYSNDVNFSEEEISEQEKEAFGIYKHTYFNPTIREYSSGNPDAIFRNCFVSFSQNPEHALKYAVGLKYMLGNEFLKPEYNINGIPKNKILGKVYIAILKENDYESENPTSVLDLHAQGDINITANQQNILAESEVSFLGYVKGKYIAYSQALKVPNFNGEYKAEYKDKFGIKKKRYNEFKNLGITINQKKNLDKLYNIIINNFSKYLKSRATKIVEKKNGELSFVGLGKQLKEVLPFQISNILHKMKAENYLSIRPGNAGLFGRGSNFVARPLPLVLV